MKKYLVTGACLFVLAVPGVASAHAPTARHAGVYSYLRRQVVHRFGAREAGRNILRDGLSNGRPVTDAMVRRSIAIYERALYYVAPAPPAPRAYAAATNYSASVPVATSPAYSGGYVIPSSVVQCESGGNWGAVNPSTGAGGAYQIEPSTWAAYGGTGSPQNASPAEQSAVAARVLAGQGAGAWSCWGH